MKNPGFDWLARSGYGARGIVFLLVAGLATFSIFGGGKADTKSALDVLLEQPLGTVWLTLIALGLIGFVAWRLAQSLANADGHDDSLKSYTVRAALFGSAVTYIGLAVYAFQKALGIGSSSEGGEHTFAAWAISQPFGRYLVGAIGVGFLIGGAVTAFKGITRRFERYLDLENSHLLLLICVYGLVARGAVFAIVGAFFCYAAITVDPSQAGSMSDALTWIRQLPFGSVLYLAVATGLAAFGLYNLVEARYRRVKPPSMSGLRGGLPKLHR
ncbi:DUF1206 domain-containing protein [Rhizobium sp. 16-449-1b]|uniref:DUF1206 domain-containing protein n=1 Tax=Rhizobium sp. 16-449-1b TaxID=2819989 RepID=UPI001AD9B23C|nr:DUF1206 domain-containing protein [Rhizobium sp. 16-449-1b]MBO9198272.1 DUF1206 domain-containing protein [Rhizobium sp. 16-449-1b]